MLDMFIGTLEMFWQEGYTEETVTWKIHVQICLIGSAATFIDYINKKPWRAHEEQPISEF